MIFYYMLYRYLSLSTCFRFRPSKAYVYNPWSKTITGLSDIKSCADNYAKEAFIFIQETFLFLFHYFYLLNAVDQDPDKKQ